MRQLDALKALLTKARGPGRPAPYAVLVLKQPLGWLGDAARAGEVVVSADGLGIMAEGQVVSAAGRRAFGLAEQSLDDLPTHG